MRRALPAVATIALLAGCNPQTSQAEDAVRHQLRDPDSAQFRGERPCERPGVEGVRGQVNAKNSKGGYSGFEAFVVVGGEVAILGGSNEGTSDIETYPTPLDRWETLFRRCNSDQTNGELYNGSKFSPAFNLDAAKNDASSAAPLPRGRQAAGSK